MKLNFYPYWTVSSSNFELILYAVVYVLKCVIVSFLLILPISAGNMK